MESNYSDFRQHLKMYLDQLSEKKEIMKVTRQRGGNVYIIPDEVIYEMSSDDFRKFQQQARLVKYFEFMLENNKK